MSEAAAHILYVEDDESLSFVTRDHLELQGYVVTHCMDGKSALAAIREQRFDLCLLDVMLPEMDGFALAEHIRQQDKEVPVLFLSAKSLKEDRLHGLRIGADDYITKPFSIEELILKIEVFLRRRQLSYQPKEAPSEFQIGFYRFDYKNLELHDDQGGVENLTQREADLLRYLAARKNQLIKRADILVAVWGEDDYFLGRSLDVFVSRLRKYLGKDERVKLENVFGVGFRLRDE